MNRNSSTITKATQSTVNVRGGLPLDDETRLRNAQRVAEISNRSVDPAEQAQSHRDAAALLAETLGGDYCIAGQRIADGSWQAWFAPVFMGDEKAYEENSEEVAFEAARQRSLAAYVGSRLEPVVVEDLEQESRFDDAFLKSRGIRSCIVGPLSLNQKVVGVVGVLSESVGIFEERDRLFFSSIVEMLNLSLARDEALREVRRQQRMREALMASVESMVIELDGSGRIVSTNQACQTITGFKNEYLHNKPIWKTLLVPEEIGMVQEAFDLLKSGQQTLELRGRILTQSAERRDINWSFTALYEGNKLATLIASGVDITQRLALAAELDRTKAAASEAKNTLADMMASHAGGGTPFRPIEEDGLAERRVKPRRAFPYVQQIAPVIDGKLPERGKFRGVHCRDICSGGFSFVTERRIEHDEFVVAFGAGPAYTYLRATVVHRTPIEHDGHRATLNGCRYVGRVEY